MHSELKNLSDAIMNICERNSYVKFWRNSDLESQLVEVKERLENAVKGFRVSAVTSSSHGKAYSDQI
jgi:hypothetical protein